MRTRRKAQKPERWHGEGTIFEPLLSEAQRALSEDERFSLSDEQLDGLAGIIVESDRLHAELAAKDAKAERCVELLSEIAHGIEIHVPLTHPRWRCLAEQARVEASRDLSGGKP